MRSYCVSSLCDGANTDPSVRLLLLESWQIGKNTICLKHKQRRTKAHFCPRSQPAELSETQKDFWLEFASNKSNLSGQTGLQSDVCSTFYQTTLCWRGCLRLQPMRHGFDLQGWSVSTGTCIANEVVNSVLMSGFTVTTSEIKPSELHILPICCGVGGSKGEQTLCI